MSTAARDAYQVVDGKIRNAACEINVVEHCNLSCRGCSHLSPIAPKYFVDPQSLLRDLTMLARVYQVDFVRLLGGEPLLHPNLTAVMDTIEASGIASRICLVTNGLLLSRMDEHLWD